MQGVLHKTDKGWVVTYIGWEDKNGFAAILPIHPDDKQYCEEGKEVNFKIEEYQPGIDDDGYGYPAGAPIKEARIILPTKASKSSWDYIAKIMVNTKYRLDTRPTDTAVFVVDIPKVIEILKQTYNPPTPLKNKYEFES